MKKYELTDEFIINNSEVKLFRIRSLIQFRDVEIGDLGGYIEKESNLSHEDTSWIYDNAQVYGNAMVYGNSTVSGCAIVYHNAQIYDNANVRGNAKIYDNALVFGNAQIYDNANVHDNVEISGNAWIFGNAQISGDAKILSNASISNNVDYSTVRGLDHYSMNTTFFRCKDGKIRVSCGWFCGDLNEFREIVKKTHNDEKFSKNNLFMGNLMNMYFN